MMDLLADDEDVEYVVTEKEKQNVLAKIIKTVTATLNEKRGVCFCINALWQTSH